MSSEKLWKYPLLFGVLGAFIGLILRYAYVGGIPSFSFKNMLHAHSHVMLLGFVFNAFIILVWDKFTKGIDKKSYNYFIALQLCMAIMMITFIIQGYALYSILFSTLHLWISYILLIKLWNRLDGNESDKPLIKAGIIFHFLSSIGPYILGPLMILGLKESPWYQQAIFFYLHFQFFGIFFIWLIAILLKNQNIKPNKKEIIALTLGLILTYAHSLDYSFDHWSIHLIGGIGSLLILLTLLSFKKAFQKPMNNFKYLYFIIILIALANFAGSIPQIGQLVVDSRFVLIAWLHLIFLGLFVPFIWLNFDLNIHRSVWFIYAISFILTEVILVFPNLIAQWFSISVLWLLFISYFAMTLSICIVHLKYLLISKN